MTGMEAYDKGDYATALKEWRTLAEQGDAEAQYGLGVIYKHARGVPQDYEQALHWYSKAAEQGHASAQYNLGLMYELGQGRPEDYEKAASWYRLGADGGHALAQYTLSVMYREGQGVPQDDVQAHMWASLAATQGDEEARKTRDILAKKMTPAQIADAQRLARERKPEIAEERKNLSIDDVIVGFEAKNLFYFEVLLVNDKYYKTFNKCLTSRPADFDWMKQRCKKNPELKNLFQCSEDSRFTYLWFIYESPETCEGAREPMKDTMDARR